MKTLQTAFLGLIGLSLLAALPMLGVNIARAQELSAIDHIAIDANPEGNTATSVAKIDGCVRVEPGAEVTVDAVVESVPEDRQMIAFETRVTYDPALLEVVANNYDDFLLSAEGRYEPFAHPELNDVVPDSDGTFITAVVDIASNDTPEDPKTTGPGSNSEAGPGVLNRVTFKAKAAGVSTIGIDYDPDEQIYPLIVDVNNKETSIARRGSAAIAIGQDCPPELLEPVYSPLPTIEDLFPGASNAPTVTPTNLDLGTEDTNTGAIAVVAVLGTLGAAATGSGGWLLYRRSKREE